MGKLNHVMMDQTLHAHEPERHMYSESTETHGALQLQLRNFQVDQTDEHQIDS